MKRFSYKSFSLDVIDVASSALHAAVDSLPEPLSSSEVNLLVKFILRIAMAGERDVRVLRTVALSQLRSTGDSR